MSSEFVNYDPWVIKYITQTAIVDNVDASLIRELIQDSRQSTQQLANKIGVSRPTAHDRIKRLKENGIIENFTIRLNHVNCGLPLRAFILVGFDARRAKGESGEEFTQKDIAKLISREEYVTKVDVITGQFDFLVQVAIDYMNSLADVIIERIRQIPGVSTTQTLLSFGEYQNGFLVTSRGSHKKL